MSGDYVERLESFLDAWDNSDLPETVAATADASRDGERPGMYRRKLNKADLRAALDELKQLRVSRTSLDGQVFISGWYAHAEACASLGWDARQAAWRKYREEMTETLAKAVPQQPNGAPCCGGPHAGWIHTVACANPQQPAPEGGD